MSTTQQEALFVARNVVKDFAKRTWYFRRRRSLQPALDGVSLEVFPGESLGIVGESGSGKTTLGRILIGFETASSGDVLFSGRAVARMRGRERSSFRRRVQMVFQNPFSSLNPFRTVRDMLSDGYAHSGLSAKEKRVVMEQLMERVGLNETMLERYPHEFSGGQRQRIVLARALTVGPTVLVADEPVSALDVSIQAQVLNLLNELKKELGLTVVMVTHDLRVVNFFCDRIAVMYMGRLVEIGTRAEIMNNSLHPYTRMLISAAPHDEPGEKRQRPWVQSELSASPSAAGGGCNFAARCWLRQQLGNPERCTSERPEPVAQEIGAGPGHLSACHFIDEVPVRAEQAMAASE